MSEPAGRARHARPLADFKTGFRVEARPYSCFAWQCCAGAYAESRDGGGWVRSLSALKPRAFRSYLRLDQGTRAKFAVRSAMAYRADGSLPHSLGRLRSTERRAPESQP